MTGIPVIGDFTSTFTGGAFDNGVPQPKQKRASSEFGLPQVWQIGIE